MAHSSQEIADRSKVIADRSGRVAFIDWFKAVGMLLIVFGHLDGDLTNTLTLPVRLKQLGVVFFIFVMGWQLAREKRPLRIVLFNRLFKIYFWGLFFALTLSVLHGVFTGNLCESNYLPFFFGINVLLDYFPSNPTTWYIGTYIHVLIIWAVCMRTVRVSFKLLIVSIVLEIAIRGFLMGFDQYRAYMLVFNWQTVFLVGMFFGQRDQVFLADTKKRLPALFGYMGFVLAWLFIVKFIHVDRRFPFDLFLGQDSQGLVYLTSMCISLVYIGHALCFFPVARQLPNNRIIEFFANNTLVIFILHMPVWYLISPYMKELFPWHPFRIVMDLAILYIGIGGLSYVLEKNVPWRKCKLMIQQRWIENGAM
nr:acyltransferase [uncultured Desulfobacter sp.]